MYRFFPNMSSLPHPYKRARMRESDTGVIPSQEAM